jgi:hypothetical protein
MLVAHRGAGAVLTNLGWNRAAVDRLEQARSLHDPEQDRGLAFEFGQDLRLTADCWLAFARLVARCRRRIPKVRHRAGHRLPLSIA